MGLLFWTTSLLSQTSDTIYVYETVHLTDTVWLKTPVERDTARIELLESISNATLFLDTLNAKATLIYFSEGKSATIPINRIYVNRNQFNSTKMKRAGFFTLMFLAFQSISFAQPEFSVKVGVSQFWDQPFTTFASGPIFGDHQGFELKGPLKDSKFSFSVGYELHGFGANDKLMYENSEGIFIDQLTVLQENHRSIPILLYYRLNRLELFGGYEYRYVEVKNDYRTDGTFNSFFRNEHALSAGMEIFINKHVSVFGKLYLGDALVNHRPLETYNVKNGTSLDLSLKYYLNRTREIVTKEKRVNSPRYF
ncbi:MAG: outer membrane beta-barrel protein [Prolixibacteraceae bacterium]